MASEHPIPGDDRPTAELSADLASTSDSDAVRDADAPIPTAEDTPASPEPAVAGDRERVQYLEQAIADLQAQLADRPPQAGLTLQIDAVRQDLERLRREVLAPLERQHQDLEAAIALLQKKQERLQQEMRTTYAGASQEIAVRVQGFRDYLVGSLQDLVTTVEELDLVPPPPAAPEAEPATTTEPAPPKLSEQAFGELRQRIEQLLEQYRTLPDYYGPPWKLRRTFEAIHADRVAKWLFDRAGRGAVRTMGTRLQNILVAAAAVSVLRSIYGDKLRVLILATSPERLGEWRRGFQDCLGIGRDNFGPERGVVLFEDPEPLVTKADRLEAEGYTPLIVIDEAEEFIFVDMLRFSLLLAFGRDPEAKPSTYYSRDRDAYRDFF